MPIPLSNKRIIKQKKNYMNGTKNKTNYEATNRRHKTKTTTTPVTE